MPEIVLKAPDKGISDKKQKISEVLAVARKLRKLWDVAPGKTSITPGFFPVAPGCDALCDIEIFAWDLPGREKNKIEVTILFERELPWLHKVYICLQPQELFVKV